MYLEAKIIVTLKENSETIVILRRKRIIPVTCQCQRDIISDYASLRVWPSVSTSELKLPHREPAWPHRAEPITKGLRLAQGQEGRSLKQWPWALGLSLRES